MAYVSQWEQLSEAVTRVMAATAVSEQEARADICRAVADRAIKIQCKLKRHARGIVSTSVLEGKDFDIPTEIKPEDLDWEQSCPVKPWFARRDGAVKPHGYWLLKWIELFGPDVTRRLCGTPALDAEAGAPTSATKAPKPKNRPALEAAKRAIQELYPAPAGPPDQTSLPNARLCRQVGQKLKELGLPHISDDTILRAADRRK